MYNRVLGMIAEAEDALAKAYGLAKLLHVCPPKANMGHSDPGFWIRKQGE